LLTFWRFLISDWRGWLRYEEVAAAAAMDRPVALERRARRTVEENSLTVFEKITFTEKH